ncbi:hypothetical protein HHK36_023494 [Tetracentron sinense]|uniref:Uncharacterized protein n=1 Tax=Tetracentron sinense TaxID=13715 RepID=A0A834YSG4_TETSI|nr:hypothetical protein HHK36_023494 [Tetracentron sinense]
MERELASAKGCAFLVREVHCWNWVGAALDSGGSAIAEHEGKIIIFTGKDRFLRAHAPLLLFSSARASIKLIFLSSLSPTGKRSDQQVFHRLEPTAVAAPHLSSSMFSPATTLAFSTADPIAPPSSLIPRYIEITSDHLFRLSSPFLIHVRLCVLGEYENNVISLLRRGKARGELGIDRCYLGGPSKTCKAVAPELSLRDKHDKAVSKVDLQRTLN